MVFLSGFFGQFFELGNADHHGGVGTLGYRCCFVLKQYLIVAQGEYVAIVQGVSVNLFAINEGAIGAAKVFYIGRVKHGNNLRMVVAYGRVIDAQGIVVVTADAERALLKLELVDVKAFPVTGDFGHYVQAHRRRRVVAWELLLVMGVSTRVSDADVVGRSFCGGKAVII